MGRLFHEMPVREIGTVIRKFRPQKYMNICFQVRALIVAVRLYTGKQGYYIYVLAEFFENFLKTFS